MTTTTQEPKAELALLPPTTALALFEGGNVRTVLDKIKAEVLSIVTDPTTEKGRKEIISLARKVASTKVAMDDMGKDLTEEQRKMIDRVNEERRLIRDELDALRDKVRAPVTEYENREKERVAKHEAALAEISKTVNAAMESRDSLAIEEAIFALEGLDVSGFEEFKSRAETEKAAGLHRLSKLSDELHAEKVERERIAKEKAEAKAKEQAEREARIAAEAAEKARIAAELEAKQKADAESARVAEEARKAEAARVAEREAESRRIAEIEREKLNAERRAKEEAERAEQERLEAEARHKRELAEAEARAKREAEEKERARIAAEEAEKAAEEKRAANAKHRKKILNEVASDLANELHLADELAGLLAAGIASGKIRHISIQF
jgi:hypothetical protein